jgi:hypothetical protein
MNFSGKRRQGSWGEIWRNLSRRARESILTERTSRAWLFDCHFPETMLYLRHLRSSNSHLQSVPVIYGRLRHLSFADELVVM